MENPVGQARTGVSHEDVISSGEETTVSRLAVTDS
jgi:hypothetical protein